MVVDDEAFNVRALVHILRMMGLPQDVVIDTAFNGQEAVELMHQAVAERQVDRYQLILMDCSMPILDGYLASRQIRELIQEHGPVGHWFEIVAVTANVEQVYI